MRKHLFTILFILVFLVGLSVLLYPVVADFYNSRLHSDVIYHYNEAKLNLSDDDSAKMLEDAREYNKTLLGKPDRFKLSDEEMAVYWNLLNIGGSEVMGIVEIEKINVNLPIYHGTSEGVLQVGAGHLEGSSLPVGGSDTHAVITGHRGLPSSTLFTHLDRIRVGDTFVLHVLNETLTYQVDQIVVVLPEERSELEIVKGMDYCTLITCTPYGINSHRILIRGQRVIDGNEIVINTPALDVSDVKIEAQRFDKIMVAMAVAAPFIVVAVIYSIVKYRKNRGRR